MIHSAICSDLSPGLLYELMRLRVDVFVVEQRCPYPELDGRDTDASTVHVWSEHDGGIGGYLRILADAADAAGARRIGRVCVAPAARGRGLAGSMMQAALQIIGPVPVVLDAQAHLTGWYGRFGFAADGPEFLDDGIPHVPMLRPAG